jgi:hypothetical protein
MPKSKTPKTQSEPSSTKTQETLKVSPGLPPTLHEPFNLEPGATAESLVRMNEYWSYDPSTHSIGLTTMLEAGRLAENRTAFLSSVAALNAQGWTLIIDYAATGEGRHVWYQRSHASSKALAIEEFRETFFKHDDDKAWTFWSQGLEVHQGAYWPEYVKGYVMPPSQLEMHWESIL